MNRIDRLFKTLQIFTTTWTHVQTARRGRIKVEDLKASWALKILRRRTDARF